MGGIKLRAGLDVFTDEWIYFQSSFYHLSTERKNWDDSRQDNVSFVNICGV